MLQTIGDIKNDVLVKLNVSTTVSFYSDSLLNTWILEAYMRVASAHLWPVTAVKDTSLNWSSSSETYNYPAASNFKSNSIRFLQVGSNPAYRLQKLNFEDYQIFREETSNSNERVFSEFNRVLYINPTMVLPGGATSGGVTLWGHQNVTAPDMSIPTSTTVFTNAEEELNEAVAYLVMAYAKMKEQKLGLIKSKGGVALGGESAAYKMLADEIIETTWKRIQDEQFAFQTKNRGMFKRIDLIKGAVRDDEFKRDQFY